MIDKLIKEIQEGTKEFCESNQIKYTEAISYIIENTVRETDKQIMEKYKPNLIQKLFGKHYLSLVLIVVIIYLILR